MDNRLQENSDFFRSWLENVSDVMTVMDTTGKILWESPSVLRVLGMPARERTGQNAFSAIHRDDLDRALAMLTTALRRPEESHRVEFRFQRKDGEWRHLEAIGRASRTMAGDPCVFATTRDITERKIAEEAARASEERFRTLVESMQDIVFVLDRAERVVSLHGRWKDRLSHSVDRYVGRTAADVFSTADAAIHHAANLKALAGERVFYDFSLETVIGPRQFHTSLAPIPDAVGGIAGLVGVARDVTERRELENRMHASQKLEGIGRLAGGVAHEYNNLLTTILGYCELSLQNLPENSPMRRNLEMIRNSGQRASVLTQQLLAYGRRQVLQPRLFDLNTVLASTAQMLRVMLGEEVQVQILTCQSPAPINADPSQIEQVVVNMSVNAQEAMPRGGRLSLSTDVVQLGDAEARPLDLKPGGYVRLVVSDTGEGIQPDQMQHLFEPFFTTKGLGKGTGLGLSSAYGMVRQSGGTIDVASVVGKGTTFRVYFPFAGNVLPSAAMSGPEGQSALDKSPLEPHTVLVVEDEPIVRELLTEILQEQRYRVLAAASGADALALAAAHVGLIHCMVTDVVMPEMSGRELAEQLLRTRPNLRVLYISGHTEDVKLRYGLEESKVPFLAKPFPPDALARRVRELLAGA